MVSVDTTEIPGLLVVHLDLHGDNRGWFKENWQRSKMTALGLPDFGPVQNNVSFNADAGTIRGIHAEPWDKFVSVAAGRAFGAWVDLREGESFGRTFWIELNPETAVFVPRGVANSFQVLEDRTAYSYLVNAHWRADATYTNVNLLDPALAIPWPAEIAEMSEKDKGHPLLADVTPMPAKQTVVIGANGQLGRALRKARPDLTFYDRSTVDLADPSTLDAVLWDDVQTIINAAAYTNVDGAETPEGRRDAWAVNVTGVAALARIAIERGLTLVNVSSDYVFDGTVEEHPTDEPLSPLGVYGQTKAAGEAVTSTVPRHYIVRTSWVIGDGKNFVETMRRLARDGVSPSVVDDQIGRLTHADDLAAGILRLLDDRAPFGVHHVTGPGEPRSWAAIAREVFAEEGRDPGDVTGVSTEEYAAGKPTAPRPRHSALLLP